MRTGEGFFAWLVRVIKQGIASRARLVDDPTEALDLLIESQMTAIAHGRADIVLVTSSEKRIQGMLDELQARINRYDAVAKTLLTDGNSTELVRLTLRRQIECERLLRDGKMQLEEVSAERKDLSELIEQMRSEYDRLKMRREGVRALSSSARASIASNEVLTPVGEVGRAKELGLESARETLAQLQSRASALSQLRNSGAIDAVGAGEFDSRSVSDADVDARLKSLTP